MLQADCLSGISTIMGIRMVSKVLSDVSNSAKILDLYLTNAFKIVYIYSRDMGGKG